MGERNYGDFFRVMLAIFAMQVFHLSASLALCIDIFLDGPTVARADSWWGEVTMLVLLLSFMAFDAFSLVLLVQLVWFHLGLQREQITTYQYIIRDHQRRRDRNKLQRELEHQRATAIAKAERDGRRWERCRLMWGEESRKMGCGDTCDPLKMPTQVSNNDDAGFAAALGGGSVEDDEYNNNNNNGTASDGDEEASPYTENGNDEPPVEQAISPPEEPPGVQFLRVQDGEDIMAEPGAHLANVDGTQQKQQQEEEEEEERGKQRSSQPWEIPSADGSELEGPDTSENDEKLPHVDHDEQDEGKGEYKKKGTPSTAKQQNGHS